MTLGDIKKEILSLIEEIDTSEKSLTRDPDIAAKLNYVINQIQNELSRHKKIPARKIIEVTEDNKELLTDTIDDFYQLRIVRGVKCEIIDNLIMFKDKGTAEIFYYKYPTQINADTQDSHVFELSIDVLGILPYGVAADVLKSDVSNNYGAVYANRYKEMLQQLDPRHSLGSVVIEGGVDL